MIDYIELGEVAKIDRSAASVKEYALTPYSQQAMLGSVNQSSQANLFIGQIATLPVLLPPLALQERFAAIAQRHERLRGQQRKALRQAEQLFGALLGRAFRGELGFSQDIELLRQLMPGAACRLDPRQARPHRL